MSTRSLPITRGCVRENAALLDPEPAVFSRRQPRGIVLFLCAVLLATTGEAAIWNTELAAAQAKAKAEGKNVLINFTGSDWCGWCIRLKNEVFSKPDFDTFANQNLVLVEIDFPRKKAQSKEVKEANRELAEKYGIQGFPTLVVLNGEGRKVGQLGYVAGGPKPFLTELRKQGGAKPGASASGSAKAQPSTPPAAWANDLLLRGISGSAGNRFALINNQTLGAGEAAIIHSGARLIKVRVVEIKEKSVLVQVDDAEEPTELRLRGRL